MPETDHPFYIWEGIYPSFPESENDEVWDSEQWISSQKKNLELLDLKGLADNDGLDHNSLVNQYPLPQFISAIIAEIQDRKIEVLDFGGGMGDVFPMVFSSLPDPEAVRFHVVESAAICRAGREVFADFGNIIFHEVLPEEVCFDVVHTAAVLHYIKDWRAVLKKLADYKPRFFMLNALNAGAIKTFGSYQNYYGKQIPVWFFNIDEICSHMIALGYRLIFQSLQEFTFLGRPGPLPMENFPPEYRLDRKCNLVFSRSDNIG